MMKKVLLIEVNKDDVISFFQDLKEDLDPDLTKLTFFANHQLKILMQYCSMLKKLLTKIQIKKKINH